MARPRVFVSSTYYDLKHIRSSIERFVESLGFESILSEKGEIAFAPDQPLDESCYREAANADLFVLVIGGRYGSEASSGRKKEPASFFDRYDSITKKEYESATVRDIPIYILIEGGVYSEYQTYLRNKENEDVKYAHVDSANIFRLIEEILSRPRNNPVHTFERFADIESWLREQWAGMFRELLQRQSQHKQLATLTSQVAELKEVNETLKTYLEAVMRGVDRDVSSRLIQSEKKRLDEVKRMDMIRKNDWYEYVSYRTHVPFDVFVDAVRKATSLDRFAAAATPDPDAQRLILDTLISSERAREDFNKVRDLLGLPPILNIPPHPLRKPRSRKASEKKDEPEHR